jgi:uncharacterized protein YuzE
MKYIYDEFIDSIVISSKKAADKVKGSVKIGDIIIDITTKGKVAGLEVRHFSDWLKRLNVKNNVKKLTAAEISVTYKADGLIILVYLKFDKEEESRLPIYISTETPKMAVA